MPTTNNSLLEDYFQFRCLKGLEKRGFSSNQEYIDRLQYEISVITEANFVSYFLIVSDICNWALSNGIVMGPSRGSCGASLVSYCLYITHIDPIKHQLYFERFLNPHRAKASFPDIDLDFQDDRRDEVIRYIQSKFGEKCVAHIGTYGTMKAKAAIRDLARTFDYPYETGDKLAKLVLPPISGKVQKLEVCYQSVPELKRYRSNPSSPEGRILRWAERFEDRIKSLSSHASGVVISDNPITDRIPLFRGKDEKPTTQFDMGDVEQTGLIKFDILGIKTLRTIATCIQLIKKNHGITINPLEIPMDDTEVYSFISSGDVDGMFQLECSSGLRDLTVRIKPRNVDDISMLIALYRPGPIGLGLLDQVVGVRNGDKEPSYDIEELRPILEDTAGVCVFQEQLMRICTDLAGFSMAEADTIRKMTGKKDLSIVAQQREKFVSKMVEKGYDRLKSETLFSGLEGFALYSFNKGHSCGYAYITYWTAWLKYYYRPEFVCACLSTDSNEEEKVIKYLSYCRDNGIKVLPPDINESEREFTVNNRGQIRFGLGAVKNLGISPVDAIIKERREGNFSSIIDFCNRVNLTLINKKKIESLILAGTFDQAGKENRATLLEALSDIYKYRQELVSYQNKDITFFKKMNEYLRREEEISSGVKKPHLKKPKKPMKPREIQILSSIEDLPLQEKISKEKELVGFYISGHPIDFVSISGNKRLQSFSQRITVQDILQLGENKQKVCFIGIITDIKEITTKKKKEKMAFLTLEDRTGTIQTVCFAKTWAKISSLMKKEQPLLFNIEIEVISQEDDDGNQIRLTKGRMLGVSGLLMDKSKGECKETIDITTNIRRLRENIQQVKKEMKSSGEQERNINLNIELEEGTWVLLSIGNYAGNANSISRYLGV